jgi:hexulose-6-phosphate isomerase
VAIAVENVWNKFLLSPIEFAQYVDSFDHDLLRAYFDVGNIVAYGFPQHWIRTLGKRIRKIHIKGFDAKTHAWVQLLEGSIDWQAVMDALTEIGYDDVITAELRGKGDDEKAGLKAISDDMDTIFAMAD